MVFAALGAVFGIASGVAGIIGASKARNQAKAARREDAKLDRMGRARSMKYALRLEDLSIGDVWRAYGSARGQIQGAYAAAGVSAGGRGTAIARSEARRQMRNVSEQTYARAVELGFEQASQGLDAYWLDVTTQEHDYVMSGKKLAGLGVQTWRPENLATLNDSTNPIGLKITGWKNPDEVWGPTKLGISREDSGYAAGFRTADANRRRSQAKLKAAHGLEPQDRKGGVYWDEQAQGGVFGKKWQLDKPYRRHRVGVGYGRSGM